jgi:hypothetical protein
MAKELSEIRHGLRQHREYLKGVKNILKFQPDWKQ